MKKVLLTALIAIAGFTAQAQAQVQETRNVNGFSKIEVKNGIELIVTQGETASVKIESDDLRKLDNIVTEINGNTLKLYIRKNESSATDTYNTMKVYVTGKEITGLKASSGASVKINGEMKANGLAVDLSSGGSFKGKINCTGSFKLDAGTGSNFDGIITSDLFHGDLVGGAVVKIAGMAKNSVITTTGGATCLAANFKCDNVKVNAKRTSSVVVNAKDSIRADADDTASITYYGSTSDTSLGANSYAVRRR